MLRRTCFSGDTMVYTGFLSFHLFLLLFSVVLPEASPSDDMEQRCDWTGSGGGDGGRGVRPVYLRCRAGTVKWKYPGGALRVLLRLPGGSREFRACLRPGHRWTASLYLEAPRTLSRLYTPEDAPRRHVRCFQSRGGQAAVYVEAAEHGAPPGRREVAEFSYDLTPLPRGVPYHPDQECRPCTTEEMMQAFCTSELVVKGIIQRVEPIEGTDVSEIKLRVTKVLRESAWWEENEIDGGGGVVKDGVAGVEVGRECGAHHGSGELVVMARRRLGRPLLVCAPMLREWLAIVRKAARSDSAHCLLAS